MKRFVQVARAAVLAGSLAALAGCTPSSPEPADLVLLNGRLVTVDAQRPVAEALAARDGRIVAVGSNREVRRLQGPDTRALDLEGRLVVPGFIEGHGHFAGLGRSLMNLDLRNARSWDEVVDRVARAAGGALPDQWILGWGWHQEKWDAPPKTSVEGYPTRESLDRAVPDHPVLLRHAAGSHAVLVNRRALELAGIDGDTPDPDGGRILRDAGGRATGVLFDNAYDPVHRAWTATESDTAAPVVRRQLERADEECLSKGVTSFHDAGASFAVIDVMRAMAEQGRLGVRLWVMIGEDNDRLEAAIDDYPLIGAGDGHLTVRAIKRVADGALGSHSAWLLKPYSDHPDQVGLNTESIESLERSASLALAHGLQLCVHAIGDRANREVLDVYERTFGDRDGSRLRWRVEHAQHLSAPDIPRFAELGVIASMQGIHCTSDAPWVPVRLGDARAEEGAYVWRKLLDSGATVINGTDTPVEDVDPLASFHASVTRRAADGSLFYPEQRMTRMEALESYTIEAARAAFEEDVKGSLSPGKLADVVVLSEDILEVPEERILEARVLYTIVGGEIRYAAPGSPGRSGE